MCCEDYLLDDLDVNDRQFIRTVISALADRDRNMTSQLQENERTIHSLYREIEEMKEKIAELEEENNLLAEAAYKRRW